MVNIGSSIPSSGIFKKDFNSSFNFGLGLELKLSDKSKVFLEFSNSKFKANFDSASLSLNTLKTYIISLNGKYNFYSKDRLSINAGVGFGYNYYKLEYQNVYSFSVSSSSDGSYSIIPFINLEYKLIPRVYLTSSFDYNYTLKNNLKLYNVNIGTGEMTEIDTYNLSYYQIKFGLKYSFKL